MKDWIQDLCPEIEEWQAEMIADAVNAVIAKRVATAHGVMRQALEVLEQLQGGCTDSDDGTVEAITVHCPEVIDALREALGERDE